MFASKLLNRLCLQILASFFPRFNVNYVPGTPTSLSGMNATALRRVAHEKKLRENSIRPSVFEMLKTAVKVIDGVVNVVKAGIFMEIDTPPDNGQSCRVAMRKPLAKAPQLGTAQYILGNEDEQDLVWTELYYNEIKKGVKFKKWGYEYNDTAYLKFIETYGPAISEFMAEYRDTRIHQALTVTYADELTVTPVSCARQFNKNWCIPNLDEANYPAWDNTALTDTAGAADADNYYSSRALSGATTIVENIAAALLQASGTGSTSKALLNVDTLLQVSYYVANELLIDPVLVDGLPSYVFLIASRVKHWTMNPNKSGSLGAYWQNVAEYTGKDKDRMSFPGEIGRFNNNLIFVENHRAPTLKVTGGVGTYSITIGYCNPGNNDDRNKAAWSNTSGSTNYVFDLCYVLGANALAEYLVDPLNTNLQESTEYSQIQGRGAYLGSGIQIPAFDKDAGSRLDGASTTQIQKGSCIVPVSRAPIVTIS